MIGGTGEDPRPAPPPAKRSRASWRLWLAIGVPAVAVVAALLWLWLGGPLDAWLGRDKESAEGSASIAPVPAPAAAPAAVPAAPAATAPVASQPIVVITHDQGTRESRARAFVSDYFADWSADPATALSLLAALYAPDVRFYGLARTREQVLAAKRTFAIRWPQRRYRANPAVTVTCNERDCTVIGVVHYECASTERNATASGAAEFSLTLDFSGATPLITAESGRVLERGQVLMQ